MPVKWRFIGVLLACWWRFFLVAFFFSVDAFDVLFLASDSDAPLLNFVLALS